MGLELHQWIAQSITGGLAGYAFVMSFILRSTISKLLDMQKELLDLINVERTSRHALAEQQLTFMRLVHLRWDHEDLIANKKPTSTTVKG